MTIDSVDSLDLRKAIEHLQETYGYEMLLIESGSSTTVPCYSETLNVASKKAPLIDYKCDGNPIDTIFLSVFEGQLIPDDMAANQ